MSKRALIPLPTVTEPTSSVCYQFFIPDDAQWKAMFWGALYQLTAWNSYDRDEAHTAIAIAATWLLIIDNARHSDCEGGMTLQFRQTNCLLEFSLDGGLTWDTAYVGADCLQWGIDNGVILGGDAINDAILGGQISGGQQQPPTTPPDLGFCKSFYVTLSANQRWICPTPIDDNYTISVQQCQGGWTDGVVAGPWFCPQGTHYLLGQCENIDVPAETGDPLSTANHMRLVANYDTVWFDVYNRTYVVPSGTGEQQLFIQANDGDLSDNVGSVTFKVTICRATWHHEFDFTTGQHGWQALHTGAFTRAAWVAGQGWHHNYPSGDYCDRITFYIDVPGVPPGSQHCTATYFEAQVNSCSGIGSIGLVYGSITPYPTCASGVASWSDQQDTTQFTVDVVMDCAYDPYVTKVILEGLGPDPFA